MSSRCIGQVNDQSLVTNSVFAGFIHEAVQENQQVILSCRRSVRGKVTWSRESAGRRVDVLTAYGSWNTKHDDRFRHYSVFADKSLYIQRAAVSDSGTADRDPIR